MLNDDFDWLDTIGFPEPISHLDAYVDASGQDRWPSSPPFYIIGMVLSSDEHQPWTDWITQHRDHYGGMVHWGEGRYGLQSDRMPNKKAALRAVLSNRPWAFACIAVVHQNAFMEQAHVRAGVCQDGSRIPDHLYSSMLWSTIPVKLCLLHAKHKLRVRSATFHRPGPGNVTRLMVSHHMESAIGVRPVFKANGDPGIDLVDGLCWGIQRIITRGEFDAVPWGPDQPLEIPGAIGSIFGIYIGPQGEESWRTLGQLKDKTARDHPRGLVEDGRGGRHGQA